MVDVTIKVRQGGPYKVSGPASVRDASGDTVHAGGPDAVAVLCRCGRSARPPDCDGSHRRVDPTPGP